MAISSRTTLWRAAWAGKVGLEPRLDLGQGMKAAGPSKAVRRASLRLGDTLAVSLSTASGSRRCRIRQAA
jgi:hypothetical protein